MIAYRQNPTTVVRRVAVFDQSPAPVLKTTTTYYRYDWIKAEQVALSGRVPPPPQSAAKSFLQVKPTLDRIVALTREGNLAELRRLKISAYNSRQELLIRYRDLCIKALSRSPIR
jgi:hypothetical protein